MFWYRGTRDDFFIGYRTDKPLNGDSALLLQVSPIEDCFVLFCVNVSPLVDDTIFIYAR